LYSLRQLVKVPGKKGGDKADRFTFRMRSRSIE